MILSPYIHKTGHRIPNPSSCAHQNLNFLIQKKYKTTGDLTSKVVTSTLDIVDMQEKDNDAEYLNKRIDVLPINMALKHVTKSFQRIADMDTPTTFRQDDYAIKNLN